MIFSDQALAGCTILVTGASSGLGRATAGMIARCGGRVVALGRDEARLNATVEGLAGTGHQAVAGPIDDVDQAATLVAAAAQAAGGVHGAFHAAGTELVLPTRLTKSRQVQEVFGAAVSGAIGIARAVGRTGVMHDGGSVVFMSSVAARRGTPGMAVYSAAKAATDGLVPSLAREFASRRIRFNALACGGVDTEMHQRLMRALPSPAVTSFEAAHPLGLGSPEDVAAVAVFLLSSAARWVTGAVWTADGGFLTA